VERRDEERILFMVLCVGFASLAFGELQGASRRHRAGHPILKLRHMVEPAYPEEAKENGIRGTVVVEVLIDKQGVPQAIHAVRGNPILATTAFKAVQQWRWKPYRLNRVPVAVEMTIAVNFEP
jgi:TonB family protein